MLYYSNFMHKIMSLDIALSYIKYNQWLGKCINQVYNIKLTLPIRHMQLALKYHQLCILAAKETLYDIYFFMYMNTDVQSCKTINYKLLV